jgi:hypothetical protein
MQRVHGVLRVLPPALNLVRVRVLRALRAQAPAERERRPSIAALRHDGPAYARLGRRGRAVRGRDRPHGQRRREDVVVRARERADEDVLEREERRKARAVRVGVDGWRRRGVRGDVEDGRALERAAEELVDGRLLCAWFWRDRIEDPALAA